MKRNRLSEYDGMGDANSLNTSMTESETGTEYETSSSEISDDILYSGDDSNEETTHKELEDVKVPEVPLNSINVSVRDRTAVEAAFALLSFSNQACYLDSMQRRKIQGTHVSLYV